MRIINDLELAKSAYDAYRRYSDGKSLISNQLIPEFEILPDRIRDAWKAAAQAVREQPMAIGAATIEIKVDASAAIRETGRVQVMIQTLSKPIKGWRLRTARILFQISSFFVTFACKIAPKSTNSDGPVILFDEATADSQTDHDESKGR
jgi:hypothetical protein